MNEFDELVFQKVHKSKNINQNNITGLEGYVSDDEESEQEGEFPSIKVDQMSNIECEFEEKLI
jgi:hypothetical protein